MNQQAVIQRNGRKFIRDHYVYVAQVKVLAAGAVLTDIINIETDSSFTLVKMSVMADTAGGAQTENSRIVPLVRLSIKDGGSGRNLQDEPVDISSIAGNGQLPFVLPVPRIFKPNSSISFSFENYSAATTYDTVSLALVGYKEWEL